MTLKEKTGKSISLLIIESIAEYIKEVKGGDN